MQTIRDIMTKNPLRVDFDTSVSTCARMMRDEHVGAILVERNGEPCGIVTDRDIAIRAFARDVDPRDVTAGDVCTTRLFTVGPDDSVGVAIAAMREKALRRLLVLDHGRTVGIVSLGDLARERDEHSVLGSISAAPPNS